jgi:hypothetical protein
MKEKIFSWLRWLMKNWRFQNKTQFNSHSDVQKQLTTALKICSLSYQWFSTRKKESLDLSFT